MFPLSFQCIKSDTSQIYKWIQILINRPYEPVYWFLFLFSFFCLFLISFWLLTFWPFFSQVRFSVCCCVICVIGEGHHYASRRNSLRFIIFIHSWLSGFQLLANKSSFVSVIIISLGVSTVERKWDRRSAISWLSRPCFWNCQEFLKCWDLILNIINCDFLNRDFFNRDLCQIKFSFEIKIVKRN